MVKLPAIIHQPLHNLSTLLFIIRQVFLPQKLRLVDLAQLFSLEETNCDTPDDSFVCNCINPHWSHPTHKNTLQKDLSKLFAFFNLYFQLIVWSWAHLVSFCNPQQLPKPNPFNTRDINKPFTGRSRKLLRLLKKHYRHLPRGGKTKCLKESQRNHKASSWRRRYTNNLKETKQGYNDI